ncbi:unnamed protein product [Callosobruchus maculatus]|nr:unnamed protein product [Callosobruchus maculatus]
MYKMTAAVKNIKRAEIKLCGLLTTNNLPFSLMDTLTPLLSNIFPDSEIARGLKLKRTKATMVVTEDLGNFFLSELYKSIQEPGKFFSLVMDETTDISVKKQCAFTIIHFDDVHNKVSTRFFDIVESEGGTANDLFKTVLNIFEQRKIPITNLVGFSSDTTNVMFGRYNSVFSLLKEVLPSVVYVKCSCHMAHLAVSKACLKLPKSVEDLLRNLGSHFSRSSSRQKKFLDFQNFFKVEIHKILTPSNTRWLSIKQCVDRLLEQFNPLLAYLTELVFEDPSSTTEQMLLTMKNTFTKIYLEFMNYALGLMTSFNEIFQSEKPLLYKLKPETERLLKTICSNYIDISVIRRETDIFNLDHKNPRYFVPIEDIYLGIEATESIQTLRNDPACNKKEINTFLATILDFYIELVSNMKQRFTFEDDIYKYLNIVDPLYAQSFQTQTLAYIVNRFPALSEVIESQQVLDNEWRQHTLLDFSSMNMNTNCPEEYWKQIFKMKNATNTEIFPNLKKVINLLLILPFSNASVERVFSNLFNIKTDKRNFLSTNTVRGILSSKEGISLEGGCVKWEPSQKLYSGT